MDNQVGKNGAGNQQQKPAAAWSTAPSSSGSTGIALPPIVKAAWDPDALADDARPTATTLRRIRNDLKELFENPLPGVYQNCVFRCCAKACVAKLSGCCRPRTVKRRRDLAETILENSLRWYFAPLR